MDCAKTQLRKNRGYPRLDLRTAWKICGCISCPRVQQLHQNAQDYYNRGKYELAISTISKAIILDPYNYLFCALRASCYFQLNQVERYCADVSKARSINPRWKPGVQIVDGEMVNAECE